MTIEISVHFYSPDDSKEWEDFPINEKTELYCYEEPQRYSIMTKINGVRFYSIDINASDGEHFEVIKDIEKGYPEFWQRSELKGDEKRAFAKKLKQLKALVETLAIEEKRSEDDG